MQFHFVVGFDTEINKWFVEADTTAYFPDGSIFYPDRASSREYGHYGWWYPEEDSAEEKIDMELLRTLQYLVDTFPVPQEV